MNQKETIAAVVVTYNRRELLSKQMHSVIECQSFKIDEYYIIDNNGNDDTEEYVREYSINSPIKISYIKLPENVGGAGGFYSGMKRAYEDGHDWIILMDDDGRPYNDSCFEAVFDYIHYNNISSNDSYFINSLVLNSDNTLSFGLDHKTKLDEIQCLAENGIIKNLVNPFNGTFLSRGLIANIGFPNKDFFIKGDEYNYTLRAISARSNVLTLLSSKYYHPKQPNVINKKIFGKMAHLCIEAPWKEYYQVRNYAYTSCKMGNKANAYKFFVLRMYCALTFKCKKVATMRMMIRGLFDGLMGKLGKRVTP